MQFCCPERAQQEKCCPMLLHLLFFRRYSQLIFLFMLPPGWVRGPMLQKRFKGKKQLGCAVVPNLYVLGVSWIINGIPRIWRISCSRVTFRCPSDARFQRTIAKICQTKRRRCRVSTSSCVLCVCVCVCVCAINRMECSRPDEMVGRHAGCASSNFKYKVEPSQCAKHTFEEPYNTISSKFV